MVKAVILTEGGRGIGFGHVCRCLAIYQKLEKHKIQSIMIVHGDKSILSLLKSAKHVLMNWVHNNDAALQKIKNADIVLIDSYLAKQSNYDKLTRYANVCAFIDDNNRISYPDGVIINGNIHAKTLDYVKRRSQDYLLGLKYLPQRKSFWGIKPHKISQSINSILITLGGSDPKNITGDLLQIIAAEYPHRTKNVVIGKAFSDIQALRRFKDKKTNLIIQPSMEEFVKLMKQSDVAVSAGGQTIYELLRLGVPTIAVATADNQLLSLKGCSKARVIKWAGTWRNKIQLKKNVLSCFKKIESFKVREDMRHRSLTMLDGQGCERIVNFLLRKLKQKSIKKS